MSELRLRNSFLEQELDRLKKLVEEGAVERKQLQSELSTEKTSRAELAGQLAGFQAAASQAQAPVASPAPVQSPPAQSSAPVTPNPVFPSNASQNQTNSAPTITAEMLEAGRRGDATAQCVIGYCYAAGQGVTQDWTEALKYYRAAAQQGHPNAQYNLGTCYAKGRGAILYTVAEYLCIQTSAWRPMQVCE